MTIHETSNFSKRIEKLTKRNPRLRQKIDKKLQLLLTDLGNNSLRLHKIEGKEDSIWSISIDMKLRILFTYVENGILLFDIGTHNEVY